MDLDSYHQSFNPATQAALTERPDVPGLYRARQNFAPSLSLYPTKELMLSAGVSFSEATSPEMRRFSSVFLWAIPRLCADGTNLTWRRREETALLTDRCVLSEPDGDRLHYLVRRGSEVLVYSSSLNGVRMQDLERQYRQARARIEKMGQRDLQKGFTYTLILIGAAIWVLALVGAGLFGIRRRTIHKSGPD